MSKEQYAILTLFLPIFILLFYFIIVVIVEDIKDYFHFKKKRKILKEITKKEWEENLKIVEQIKAFEIIIDKLKEVTNNE